MSVAGLAFNVQVKRSVTNSIPNLTAWRELGFGLVSHCSGGHIGTTSHGMQRKGGHHGARGVELKQCTAPTRLSVDVTLDMALGTRGFLCFFVVEAQEETIQVMFPS